MEKRKRQKVDPESRSVKDAKAYRAGQVIVDGYGDRCLFCGETESLHRHHVSAGSKHLIGMGSGSWRRILGRKRSKHADAVLFELSQTVPLCGCCHGIVHYAGEGTVLWGFPGTISYRQGEGILFVPYRAGASFFFDIDELRADVLAGVQRRLKGE